MSNLPQFDSLTAVADELAAKSKEVNERLKDFEERVNALNLGVEAWVQDTPLEINEAADTETWLGYARHLGQWGVFVRQVRLNEVEEDRWEPEAPRQLRFEKRSLRLSALALLPALLEALEKEARQVIRHIDAAVDTAVKRA